MQMYSHVDTDGGIVDCERYSVLNILLNLCKAVKKNGIQLMLWAERTFLGWEIDNVKHFVCLNIVSFILKSLIIERIAGTLAAGNLPMKPLHSSWSLTEQRICHLNKIVQLCR